MTQTPLPKLYVEIEAKLGENLARYVATRRAEDASWRGIATELYEATGVKVSHEALRVWHQGRAPVAGAA